MHHPHLYCVVPGGGLSVDGRRWIACRRGFFLPVRVLSRMFRGKFLAFLKQAFEQGKLKFNGKLIQLSHPRSFRDFLRVARHTEWVVYVKPPFGGPAQVLDYLGRYTHRVAICNHRLVQLRDGKITFRWKDYRHGNRVRLMTLEATEFMRRFLLHVLPPGFMRLRYYGFLGNRDRARNLAQCRALLDQTDVIKPAFQNPPDWQAHYQMLTGDSLMVCPVCQEGRSICTEIIAAASRKRIHRRYPAWLDSS